MYYYLLEKFSEKLTFLKLFSDLKIECNYRWNQDWCKKRFAIQYKHDKKRRIAQENLH